MTGWHRHCCFSSCDELRPVSELLTNGAGEYRQHNWGYTRGLMNTNTRPLAMVTGASTGIGYELAKCCAKQGFDLLVVADEADIHRAAEEFRLLGVEVEAVEADLATLEGVDKFYN